MFSLSPKLTFSSFTKPLLLITFLIAGVFLLSGTAGAEDTWCVCRSNLDDLNALGPNVDISADPQIRAACAGRIEASCETLQAEHASIKSVICLPAQRAYGISQGENNERTCEDQATSGWERYKAQRLADRSGYADCYARRQGDSWFIPRALLSDDLTEACKDISIFVQLLLNIANAALAVIGSFALVFFIYGGFVLILSQGNPERVKKGRDILTAAIIGLIIAFAAYAAVQFLGTAVGLGDDIYKLKA